jgi:hypothetical protein
MPRVTASTFTDAVILAIATLAEFRPDTPVPMEEVEKLVLAECLPGTEGVDTTLLRRKIGFAFRAKREGYCGSAAPKTLQKPLVRALAKDGTAKLDKKGNPLPDQWGRGQWALTSAGIDYAYDLKGTTKDRLTLLSMGLGRDSITMLLLLVEGKLLAGGELLGPKDVDAVVFSDTGYEWDHTYKLIPRIQALCDEHGIRYLTLAKPPAEGETGWRKYISDRVFGEKVVPPWAKGWTVTASVKKWADRTWGTIEEKAAAGAYHYRAPILWDYLRVQRITLRKSAACTDQHKITPINSRLLNDLCLERFGVKTNNGDWGRLIAKGLRRPHRVMVGIAADETERVEKGAEARAQAKRKFVMPLHPLVEMDIAKEDEAPILDRHGYGKVRKSGCKGCHWQPDSHWWALSVTEPDTFADYARMEREANEKRVEEGKSLRYLRKGPPKSHTGSWGLENVVAQWRARNPDATVEDVLNKEYGRAKPCMGGMKEAA